MQDQNQDLLNVAMAIREAGGLSALRSDTERLRRVFKPVEAALSNGVRRDALLATLQAEGFAITANGFKTALQRVRAEHQKKDQA